MQIGYNVAMSQQSTWNPSRAVINKTQIACYLLQRLNNDRDSEKLFNGSLSIDPCQLTRQNFIVHVTSWFWIASTQMQSELSKPRRLVMVRFQALWMFLGENILTPVTDFSRIWPTSRSWGFWNTVYYINSSEGGISDDFVDHQSERQEILPELRGSVLRHRIIFSTDLFAHFFQLEFKVIEPDL